MAAEKHEGFTARALGPIKNAPGTWNSLEIGVFQGDKKLSSYVRNYSNFFETFYPFKRGDEWFALYSPQYTASSVMSLPECKHVGGEEPSAGGFCPIEFYVPAYRVGEMEIRGETEPFYITEGDVEDLWDMSSEKLDKYKYSEVRYLPFGFVSGCVWGDDSSNKAEVLDLRDPMNPKRLEEWGYYEIPEGVSLKDAIVIHDIEGEEGSEYILFDIAVRKRFSFSGADFSFETFGD